MASVNYRQKSRIAQTRRADEFYTLYSTVENELKYYGDYFHGKVVYCNCDNPYESNFVKYFVNNFERLGIRRLIATCYSESGVGLLGELTDVSQGLQIMSLRDSGDFRSLECRKLAEQSDVVVTNPPFSLFRDFVTMMELLGKDFLVLGNQAAACYAEVWSKIREGRLFYGVTLRGGNELFRVPDSYTLPGVSYVDGVDGKCKEIPFVRWFTTINHGRYPAPLRLVRHYTSEDYPKYDNYNAINVDRTQDIPCDYDGVMGVPLTFLDKYNPEQFELVGMDNSRFGGRRGRFMLLDGKCLFIRVLIRRRKLL